MWYLLVFDYSMILMENDSVYGFTFIENKGLDGHPEFLSVCNTFGV